MCSQVLFWFVLKKDQRLLDNQRLRNKKKKKLIQSYFGPVQIVIILSS